MGLDAKQGVTWGSAVAGLADRRVLTLFFLGVSAGLPLLLIFSTLSIWLREAGIPRADITFFSWAALGYGFKWVWAPLIDRLPLPLLVPALGRRRGWLLLAQFGIVAALVGMALTDPAEAPVRMAAFAVLLGFASASQDIVIDAYRIEAADEDLQALLSAAYIAGYRVGMLVAGAGALEIAGFLDTGGGYDYGVWRTTYLIMAGAMLIGIATTLSVGEPARAQAPDNSAYGRGDYARFFGLFLLAAAAFVAAFVLLDAPAARIGAALEAALGPLGPFLSAAVRLAAAVGAALAVFILGTRARLAPRDLVIEGYFAPVKAFLEQYGRAALTVLALIAVYRIADVVMGVIANVFYTDLGFEKEEIGRITKAFGLAMTILGGFVGGILTLRFGVAPILMLGAVLAAATNVLFAVLAGIGADTGWLILVISADNLSAGLASAVFVAFLSALTNIRFTAMQYAIFSSLMLLLPKLIGGYSGSMVDALGYQVFFIGTALLGVPVCFLVWRAARLLHARQEA